MLCLNLSTSVYFPCNLFVQELSCLFYNFHSVNFANCTSCCHLTYSFIFSVFLVFSVFLIFSVNWSIDQEA